MKKSLILAGILMFTGVLFAASPQTGWQKDAMQGKVKSVAGTFETITYTPQGYRQSITFGGADSFSGDITYSYDSSNRLLSRISRNAYREEINRLTNTYDASGLLLKTVRQGNEGNETDTHEYNSRKQLSWTKTYDSDNSMMEAVEYLYDATGNKIRENNYNEDMELYFYILFVYDKDANLLEKSAWSLPETERADTVYKYNLQGWLIEEVAYYMDEFDSSRTLFYDNYGNVTKEIMVIRDTEMPETYTYGYTFDKQGNWISKEDFSEGELMETEERVITYY